MDFLINILQWNEFSNKGGQIEIVAIKNTSGHSNWTVFNIIHGPW